MRNFRLCVGRHIDYGLAFILVVARTVVPPPPIFFFFFANTFNYCLNMVWSDSIQVSCPRNMHVIVFSLTWISKVDKAVGTCT